MKSFLSETQIKELRGLSEKEAEDSLRLHGANELPAKKKKSPVKIIAEVLSEPMLLLLFACAAVYLVLGDVTEAIILSIFMFVIAFITIYQENKTERALEALRDLASPRVLVIRDGSKKRIPGKDVALGDIIIVNEGDRVAADCLLLWGRSVKADESILTGESVAVDKLPGGDGNHTNSNQLFAGSLVVKGEGVAKVISIGIHTEMGKIGKSLEEVEKTETKINRETAKIVRFIFAIAVVLCSIVIGVYGLIRNDWLEGALTGLTLAMGILPEEMPIVVTVFFAIGAWRMSQKKVLARRVSSLEVLGSATVLCVDKTGTLTENKMQIKKIFANSQYHDVTGSGKEPLPEEFHEIVEYGILASSKNPFDPMEKALKELGESKLLDTEHLHQSWEIEEEYAISKELLALSHAYKSPEENGFIISAKGAPEDVMDLCHLSQERKLELSKVVDQLGNEGLRILGIAKSVHKGLNLPKNQHDFDFEFLGFIGWEDPVRPGVAEAIQECYNAGIRVMMITGDYPATAKSIASQIGLKNSNEFIAGPDLEQMSEVEIADKIKTTNIFCRMRPDGKLSLVNALKRNGEIVSMTGDGVNDSPALKASHIGVAMGERGTDVARESADLVVLNDDFSSIVNAVRLGRRIFDNLKKAFAYLVSVHVPIAGVSMIPVLLNWPKIIFPVHIVFLEMLIDPACSIVFESEDEEAGLMERSPKNPDEPLFGKRSLFLSLLQGVFSLAAVIGIYVFSMNAGNTETESRSLTFFTMVVANLFLIFTNRHWTLSILGSFKKSNLALKWVVCFTLLFLFLTMSIPFVQKIFKFSPPKLEHLLLGVFFALLSVIWFELFKVFSRKKGIELLRDK